MMANESTELLMHRYYRNEIELLRNEFELHVKKFNRVRKFYRIYNPVFSFFVSVDMHSRQFPRYYFPLVHGAFRTCLHFRYKSRPFSSQKHFFS